MLPSIKKSFRKVLLEISNEYDIPNEQILQDYLNEYSNPNHLQIYKYQDHTLLKDCYNNLYLPDANNNLDLIGYINDDNDVIFDKLVKKNIIKVKKPRKKRTVRKKI